MSDIDAEQLHKLFSCLEGWRQSYGILVSSTCLFLFDYVLTFSEEIRLMWRMPIRPGKIFFFLTKYVGLVSAITSLLPPGVGVYNIITALRFITIVSAEIILGMRVFAIWERNRKILVVMGSLFIALVIPIIIILKGDVTTSVWSMTVAPKFADEIQCQTIVSSIKNGWIMPYIAIIIWETVSLSLTVYKIIRWRQGIARTIRSPLLETLWRDGVIYFLFALAAGIVNIGLVVQLSTPQLRQGGIQVQTVLHSMLSTRMVLHISDAASRDVGSNLTRTSRIEFTTHMDFVEPSEPHTDEIALEPDVEMGIMEVKRTS